MATFKYYFSSINYEIRILIGSLFGVIVADGVITQFIIQKGLGKEGNPFLTYWVLQHKFLSIKILLGLLLALYLWNINRRHPKLSIYLSSMFLLGYILIIIWNLLFLL